MLKLHELREEFMQLAGDSEVLEYFDVDYDGKICDAREGAWYMDEHQVLFTKEKDDFHLLAQCVVGHIKDYRTDERTQDFQCCNIVPGGICVVLEAEGLVVGALVETDDGDCLLLGPGRITFPKQKRDPKEYYNEELGDQPMTEREMDLVDEMNDYYDKLREEHGRS